MGSTLKGNNCKMHNTHVIYAYNPRSEVRSQICITKTRLYNFDPLKPHFYIVKLGFIRVYIIFLISAEAVLTSTHNLCFWAEFLIRKNFHFLVVKCSVYLNKHVFVMERIYIGSPSRSSIKVNSECSKLSCENKPSYRLSWASNDSQTYFFSHGRA